MRGWGVPMIFHNLYMTPAAQRVEKNVAQQITHTHIHYTCIHTYTHIHALARTEREGDERERG